MTQATASQDLVDIGALRGDRKRRRRETTVRWLFKGAAITSIVISALIVLSLIGRAFDFVVRVDLATLFSPLGWFPRRGAYDIRTIVAGTFVIAGIAMLVATPLGLGAAVYLSEYAKPRIRRILKPVVEILAGIPSVVLGFFAITFISPEIVQRFFDATFFNMAAAGIAVGVLCIPIVASISEDAMRSVPHSLREASYGMGARRMTTTVRVVFPAAVSGIVAALIIGFSRAIGETMIVALAAGSTGGSAFSLDPLGPGQTMTAAMTALAIGSDQVKGAGLTFESLYFVGLLLFLMTLFLNMLSEWFVRRVREKY